MSAELLLSVAQTLIALGAIAPVGGACGVLILTYLAVRIN